MAAYQAGASASQDPILKLSQLPPPRRRDVCNQCHFQPSHLTAGIRRFGRGDYSYQPGLGLSSYRVEVDVEQEGRTRSERFEINHHAYRLQQSACFLESNDELECVTCHDPHRKASREPAHYRKVCLSCHGSEDKGCSRTEKEVLAGPAQDSGNCVSCHMPKRRAQDVVRAVVTDHFVQRPSSLDWTGQLRDTFPAVRSVQIVGEAQLSEIEQQIYSTVASIRLLPEAEQVIRLHGLLGTFPMDQPEPYHDLALGLVRVRRYEQAREILRLLQTSWPDFPLTKDWLALVESISGRSVQAVDLLRNAVVESWRPESIFNLTRLLVGGQVLDEARDLFEEAIRLRPSMQSAAFQIGRMLIDESEFEEDEKHFLRSLSMDPLYARSYLGLAEALFEQQKTEEAIVWLRLGEGVVRQADTLSQQIRILQAKLP